MMVLIADEVVDLKKTSSIAIEYYCATWGDGGGGVTLGMLD